MTTTGRTGRAPDGGGGGRPDTVTIGVGGVASSYSSVSHQFRNKKKDVPSSGPEGNLLAQLLSHVVEHACWLE